ncbi:ELM1/GtrOC1 family putative glycosyltransferase [Hansschlegelia zhihuaiae]|uniref:Nucleoside-diphosphate sugar epimerase n=1 Tax=Hansschlegelia zhihuaiae TaxID=405005 RepID=A0A4Q0MMV8_9HYPH|nr:ELM1/GtrOC1 family putative glycosyltransferase [Hansschlegelia zhihuaiae]RXF74399.1 nucleoside-diphosphate sugar epimerase [Hansschlegelia zhihuaiae]
MRAWVLTDGSADDEARCFGVAEAVADRIERRRVAPRAPWNWVAPFGPVPLRDRPEAPNSPIAPRGEWPDLVVAAGRAAAPYLAHVKRASFGRSVAAFIGDTLRGAALADVLAVTEGSRHRGSNVVAALTRPHRIGAVRLAAARAAQPLVPSSLKGPRVGVLLGEGGKGRAWTREDVARLAAGVRRLRDDGAIVIAAARRAAPRALDMALAETAHYLWDREGPDPYVALLAQSQALVAPGDDLLSIDEALATGSPVLAFRPGGVKRRTAAALDRLTARGVVRPFAGRLENYSYAPLDSTPEIARAISALVATRAALAPRPERRVAARKQKTNGPTSR